MKLLVVGCGGVGGYFGGRLAAAGVDVTFLVRPARARQLRSQGLRIRSVRGDVAVPVTASTYDELDCGYDLILLSCKAYDLPECMAHVGPSLGQRGAVLPLLNGLGHYPQLTSAFGPERVLPGYCNVSVGLGANGEIHHYTAIHELAFGQDPAHPPKVNVETIATCLRSGGFVVRKSTDIWQEVWEKFVFINALAGATTLLGGGIGDIVASNGGVEVLQALLEECQQIAAASGYPVRKRADKIAREALLAPRSPLSASMFKDMQSGKPVEAEALLGDMIRRAQRVNLTTPLLQAAYCRLQIYEEQRRTAPVASAPASPVCPA